MCGCEYARESVCRCENPVKCGPIGVHVRGGGVYEREGEERERDGGKYAGVLRNTEDIRMSQ